MGTSDNNKTKKELIDELDALRLKVCELEQNRFGPPFCASLETTERNEMKEMFQTIIDTVPVCIWWKDTDSRFLGCNQRFAVNAGYKSPQDIVGKSDYDMPWRKVESDWFVTWDRKVMEENRPYYHIVEPKQFADGKQAWLDTNKVPLRDSQGNVVGTLGTYEEITERKQTEEALAKAHIELAKAHGELTKAHDELTRAHEELEVRVQERTAELSVALDLAMEAERIKNEFFANVSHELRTPLTLNLAPLETLLMGATGPLTQQQQGLLKTMHNNSIRLLQLVSGLLDFSKLGAGKLDINPQPTDVNQLVEMIVTDFKPTAAQKLLELELATEPCELGVLIDSYVLERIVFNLLSNAVKFTPPGAACR